jgi:hypothetical protein
VAGIFQSNADIIRLDGDILLNQHAECDLQRPR